MPTSLEHLLRASLRSLLRPVARLCLRHAIRVQEVLDTVKVVFSEVAREELEERGHSVTASRISAMTGLRRKDIAPLLNKDLDHDSNASVLSRILGQWENHRDFSSRKGPRPLTYEGVESEFGELVRTVTSDLNHYAVLFELERLNLVDKANGKLKLKQTIMTVDGTDQLIDGFDLLDRDCSSLIAAVNANLMDQVEPAHLQLRTEFDNICVDALPKIQEWLLDKGASFHDQVRKHLAQFDKDSNPKLSRKRGGAKVSFSAFSFSQPGRS